MENKPILLITAPDSTAANSLYELFKDEEIRKEFSGLRTNSINDAKVFLENQTDLIGGKLTFFRLIKIGYSLDPEFHGDAHTTLIGFISVHETGMGDFFFSGGLNHNLSFAVSKQYRNRGVMTTALKMTIDATMEYGYNFIGALVKNGNFASERVLIKCGFEKVNTTPHNSTFVKRLCMPIDQYNKIFLK